jgi:beta-lactamase regulating signal transducer with metallopeptidase domain
MSVTALVDGFWTVLATGLIHGTVLAALTWMLSRTLLRRARPALMSALWTIVLIKFLVPVGPEVPVSLSGLVDDVLWPDAGEELAMVPGAVAAERPDATAAASTGELIWLAAQMALVLAYVALVGFLLARRVTAQRGHRARALALPPADPATRAAIERAARMLAMKRLPEVRMSDAVAAPQLIGLWRPILIVPEHLGEHPELLETALLHELAHLRRGDTWLRGLQLCAATLLFFWPVIYWVNRRIDEHREMACDQWAIFWGRMTPSAYARALVRLALRAKERRSRAAEGQAAGAVLGLALWRGRQQLEVRVHALVRERAMPGRAMRSGPRMGLVSGVGLVLWALISLGGAASQRAHAATGPAECVVHPGVVEYILATYPEADADGDGDLSRDEVCAHQKRLKEIVSLDEGAEWRGEEGFSKDPLLVSLDSGWVDCEACGCEDPMAPTESTSQFMDKKICTND